MKIGEIREFADVSRYDKALALKPLEEAAEVLEAWKALQKAGIHSTHRTTKELEDEIADCVQACANLAAALGIDDLRPAMARCDARNEKRGRY